MTKAVNVLSKELIENIVAEHITLGQANLKLAEYYKTLLADAPSADEAVPTTVKKPSKVPAKGKVNKVEEAVKEAVEDIKEAVEETEEDSRYILEFEDGDVDLRELETKELKKVAEDLEIELPARIRAEKIREIIADAVAEMGDEEEPEDEEEEVEDEEGEDEEEEETSDTTIVYENEDGEDVEVDLSELNARELKKLAKELDITLTAKKADGMIDEILEAYNAEAEDEAEEEEDEDEEEDLAEQLGLNDMSVEELAEILAESGLSTKGKQQALIARILKGIEDGDIELDDEEGE